MAEIQLAFSGADLGAVPGDEERQEAPCDCE
jgi:hypothetical protein